jgi:hypothetical protein
MQVKLSKLTMKSRPHKAVEFCLPTDIDPHESKWFHSNCDILLSRYRLKVFIIYFLVNMPSDIDFSMY